MPNAGGKWGVPAVISIAPSRRDDTGTARRRLVVAVTVRDKEGEARVERALVDSGAEENCIRQALVAECGLRPTTQGGTGLATLDGKEVWTYGVHHLPITATDSGGETRTSRHIFVACDFDGLDVNVILGYPWLAAVDPLLGFRAGVWWHAKVAPGIDVANAEEFYRETEGQGVYCVVVRESALHRRIGVVSASTERPANGVPQEYQDYADVFDASAAGILPEHHPMEHRIELEPGAEPPWGPIYPLGEPELKTLREYLDSSLEKGWIRRSISPAGAPILFALKKDGALRLCVDYRGLNKVTVRNRTPLPLITETLDRLRRSKVFTKLDLKDAYHRIRIREGDEWKTAFRTRYGHFEYLVMPFGLTNAPATFQAYINQALVGLVDVICVIYLDDILVFSEDPTEHTASVRQVLDRLRTHRLYANLAKCTFRESEVEFLGFLVGPHGITMDPSRVTTVSEWPTPKSTRDVQVFLGFANFYRRFIEGYSRLAGPLTNLLKTTGDGRPTGPFRMGPEALTAFAALKRRFTEAPILRHYDPALRVRLETDASGYAVSGILSQLFGADSAAKWHPIAFFSKKMTPVQLRYDTHDKELMAIVLSMEHWGQYLRGVTQPVRVLTDHNNLRYFMTKRRLNGRQSRWAESLSRYDFVIEHQPGKANPADAPSRRPDYKPGDGDEDSQFLPGLHFRIEPQSGLGAVPPQGGAGSQPVSTQSPGKEGAGLRQPQPAQPLELRRSRWKDAPEDRGPSRPAHMQESWAKTNRDEVGGVPRLKPVTGAVVCRLHVPRRRTVSVLANETAYDPVSAPIHELIGDLQRKDAFVTDRRYESETIRGRTAGSAGQDWKLGDDGLLRKGSALYVPNSPALRDEILTSCHDDPYAGHFGFARTLELVRRKYNWPGMRKDIKRYVMTCPICQRMKTKRHRPYGELAPFQPPTRPWQEITMDFVVGLPPSKFRGRVYDSILVVVDRFTKTARYIPVNATITASELAETFINTIFKDYGTPAGITSDRGPQFTSQFWSHFMFCLKIRRRLSTAFRPQTDGQTERQNQTLEHYLRCYCNYAQDDWAAKLALAEFSYNNSTHETTGKPPFYLLYGYVPTIDVEDTAYEGGDKTTAEERVEKLQAERKELAETLRKATDAHKKYYDVRHKPMRYKIGDQVMLAAKNIKQLRPNRKLADKYLGPFRVKQVVGSHSQAYRLELPLAYRIHDVFHVSLLEPYHQRADTVSTPAIDIQGHDEWEVQSIQAHKETEQGVRYLVRWAGYSPADDTWEPLGNLTNALEKVREYHAAAPQAIRWRGRRKKTVKGA